MTALISVLALLALAAPLTFLLVKAHDGKKLFNISVERLRRVLALVILGLSFAR